MPNGITPAEGQPADTIVTPSAGDGGEKQFEAITSQDALDKIIGQRLAREKSKTAEQYGDYDQLKAAAAELARIRDGEKTELQKLQDQLAAETVAREKAEQAAAAAVTAQLRIDRATAKGLPAVLAKKLVGTTADELDAEIDELLPLLQANSFDRKPNPQQGVPSKGRPSGRELGMAEADKRFGPTK